MATYLEIYDLLNNEEFGKRITVAMYRAATDLLATQNSTAKEKEFAMRVLEDRLLSVKPRNVRLKVILDGPVFGAGAGATDSQIQAAVGRALNEFIRQEAAP